jgi:dihydroorotate dehydrogenase
MGIDGLVATNTTLRRDGLSRSPSIDGGVSGAPLRERSRAVVARLHRRVPELPLIGVGGIGSGRDALDMMGAGASLVQIYTSFVYGGPSTPSRIARELQREVRSARRALGR